MNWLSPPRVRGALRVGSAVLGIGVTGWLMATLWPEPDRVAADPSLSADQLSPLASALSRAAELQSLGEGVDVFGLIRVMFIGNPAQPAEAIPASRWAVPGALELHQAE